MLDPAAGGHEVKAVPAERGPAARRPGDVRGQEPRQEQIRDVQSQHRRQGLGAHATREPAQASDLARKVRGPLSADHRAWQRQGRQPGSAGALETPERGLLDAKEFIQVAEHTGLIRPIGRRVFEEACRQAREWREYYPYKAILMCGNFSAIQFVYQADLIPQVLSDTGLDPEGLQLEITERAVMDDAEFSIGKLRRPKGLGMGFAIDDYGTGYSRLYYLKRMPVDSLKIDRSFVAGLGKDPGDEAIVSGTIDLAHALGLKVVAEGVETAEQLARLEDLGCDLAQGYFLSEPLSVGEASELLKRNNRR